VGTPGGDMARRYLSAAFDSAGLLPVRGSFQHPFTFRGRDSTVASGTNVVGYIRGTRNPGRYIVVSAHFDHVGIGRPVDGDSIYNGADDNASGTGALIEIARYLAAHPPRNSVIFAGFDAEEAGLRGARAFVGSPPVERDSIIMNINMDMVSRSEKNELYAVGSYANPVLRPYIESAMAPRRVRLLIGHEGPGVARTDDWTNQSDQGAFNAQKIPFIYFGVEDHPGYHRPSDEFAFITPGFYVGAVETVLDALLALDADLDPVAAVRR
jgi:Zn-dependent M28 family amino/carboxypeptidase